MKDSGTQGQSRKSWRIIAVCASKGFFWSAPYRVQVQVQGSFVGPGAAIVPIAINENRKHGDSNSEFRVQAHATKNCHPNLKLSSIYGNSHGLGKGRKHAIQSALCATMAALTDVVAASCQY